MKTVLWFLVVAALIVAVDGSAATVAQYDLTNADASASSTVNVASVAANATATVMSSHGALGTPFANFGSFCYLSWPTGSPLDPTRYYEFTISPVGGYEIVYSDVDLAVASGGAGTGAFEIHASTDGFATSDIPFGVVNFPVDATWHAYNINIASLGAYTGTITFRFYMYNIPASGFAGLGVNPAFGPNGRDLTVNGTIRLSTVPTQETTWSGIKAMFSN